MTNAKRFIKSATLTAVLALIASCSGKTDDKQQDSDHIKISALADSILNQAHSQARDSYFMENNDHIFCGTETQVVNARRNNNHCLLAQLNQHAKADSAKYADALIRDAHLFNNMEDFNKKYDYENNGHSTNHVYINYCRYRRSVAQLNVLKKHSNTNSK